MFGKNPIRSISYDPEDLNLQQIFPTLQGEGPDAGRPSLFIRWAGCNLACTFCDTEFETGMIGAPLTPAEVIKRIVEHGPSIRRFVVMTGGEPLRQNWTPVATWLLENGTQRIQIETAGTCWQPGLEPYVAHDQISLVCSPKTPKVHRKIEEYCKHWKYIVRATDQFVDGIPAGATQGPTQHRFTKQLYRPPFIEADEHTIWLSPCDEYDEQRNATNRRVAVESCMRYGYRLSLQTHKILGIE